MVEIRELTEFVEAHPDNHTQRWRLAKKLYMAWEYRLALDHLCVLKERWETRVNVARYLSATYYRLGRYEDSERELLDAIQIWPDELALRQQLARVLEMAGKREEAAEAWQVVKELQPENPVAPQAVERLLAPPSDSPENRLGLTKSDSGIDLTAGMVCSSCGARNDVKNESCWQCGTFLARAATGATSPTPHPAERGANASSEWLWVLVGGLLTATLVTVGVYLTLSQWLESTAVPGDVDVPHSLHALLADALLLPRVVAGIAFILVWPLALRMAVRLCRATRTPGSSLWIASMLLATSTYCVLWAPVQFMPAAALIPAVVSLALVATTFRVRFGQAMGIWLIQGAITLAVAPCCLAAFEGSQPILEFPAIVRYGARWDAAEGIAREPRNVHLPAALALEWGSTGSEWLDEKAGRVEIEIAGSQPMTRPTAIKLSGPSGSIYGNTVDRLPHSFVCQVAPDLPYRLAIDGTEGYEVTVQATSLLPAGAGE